VIQKTANERQINGKCNTLVLPSYKPVYQATKLMARQKHNVVMNGISGKIGDMLILKQYEYGTVVSKLPDRSKVKLSSKQKASNEVFRKAVRYVQQVLKDPAQSALYRAVLTKGKSVYHTALADYFAKNALGN
jgi:hypothetical protein